MSSKGTPQPAYIIPPSKEFSSLAAQDLAEAIDLDAGFERIARLEDFRLRASGVRSLRTL